MRWLMRGNNRAELTLMAITNWIGSCPEPWDKATSWAHKDLIVEVDAMEGRMPIYPITLAHPLDMVKAAFATAPNALVQNRDGNAGIALHLTRHSRNQEFG